MQRHLLVMKRTTSKNMAAMLVGNREIVKLTKINIPNKINKIRVRELSQLLEISCEIIIIFKFGENLAGSRPWQNPDNKDLLRH